jgi:hypothetical protein
MKRLLICVVLLMLVGCGERTARLYNLTTGEVTTITYVGKRLTATLPSGESISGEYATVSEGTTSWGTIYSNVYGNVGATPISLRDNTQVVGGTRSRSARGSAIATGDRGTIIQCEYITGATAGSGACEDNHGTKYKLMF